MNKIKKHPSRITLILLAACLVGLPAAYTIRSTKLAIAASEPTDAFAVFNGKMMQRSLNGTSWTLVSWGTQNSPITPLTNTQITAQFTSNAIRGSASCNSYNATYRTNGSNLTVNNPATTRKACSPEIMRQESQYLAALQTAQRYRIDRKGLLQISYRTDRGSGLLTLRPQRAANPDPSN